MSDDFVGIPFAKLLNIIEKEYKTKKSIFGISEFYKSTGKLHSLGPAAGPHTQLAQNIITSYLVGSRFIELKTVQAMDNLGKDHLISKPCIDARDEGYNVEWSSEFTLKNAFDEYIKAYFGIYYVQNLLGKKLGVLDFTFNMSVGYTLNGIKEKKMQKFIDSLINAENTAEYVKYSVLLNEKLGKEIKIPANICNSVTISTMHGCPPNEIKSICEYMLDKKNLNTYVKLNPTLLGYECVANILEKTGFNYIKLKKESFEKDLSYPDAVIMLKDLKKLAEKKNLLFGVKLTNTLGNINDSTYLSGEERYMSGRALLPISLRIASLLSDEFNGNLPISYSGGVSAFSAEDIYRTGIRPLTLATDILKPGGYNRISQIASILDHINPPKKINVDLLKNLADNILEKDYVKKDFRGTGKAKVKDELPLYDCYVAPCVQACPINQNIPDYVNNVSEKKYDNAMSVISEANMLPGMTCVLCDQKCKSVCSRMDYEGPIEIKEAKKSAFLNSENKVAVIGAGPSGLAASYLLAKNGYSVHLFEKEKNAGGVVANFIPDFRIDKKFIKSDIDRVKAEGVKFFFNSELNSVKASILKSQGYKALFYAIGCEEDNTINIPGIGKNIYTALNFLKLCRDKGTVPNLGKDVVVLGGGNTAMDIARSAIRKCHAENVTIVYRRSEVEMSADRDEVNEAIADGVKFVYLANAHSYKKGKLTCSVMKLGEVGSDGRRTVLTTDQVFTLPCDTVITALGMHVSENILKELEINDNLENVYKVGDMLTGPSTIVKCIKSAKDAVSNFIQSNAINKDMPEYLEKLMKKRNTVFTCSETNNESRCLDCSFLCNKCVDVCPNRANVAVNTRNSEFFKDIYQIIHLDSLCNECGNCATFCEHEGRPYSDKVTYFDNEKSFNNSKNKGFYYDGKKIICRPTPDEDPKIEVLAKIFLSEFGYLI